MRDDALEKGNGSFNLLRGKEANDTNLSQSAVVEFLDQALGLGLLGLVLGKAKGVE